MRLYKKQIRVFSYLDAGQGTIPETKELTGWLDEEEGEAALKRFRAKAEAEGWWSRVYGKERFEFVKDI